MNKAVRRTINYSLITLGLIIVFLLAAPLFVDVNDYKPTLIEYLEQATGRKTSIGDISASLFPWVGVRLEDVRLSNREGFSDQPFLSVKSLDVKVALLPLLRKKVDITRFVLDAPQLLIERNHKGEGNWEDLLAAGRDRPALEFGKPADQGQSGGFDLTELKAEALRLKGGEVVWLDAQNGTRLVITHVNLEIDDVRLDKPVPIHLAAEFGGETFRVDAQAGPIGDLSRLDMSRLPVQATVKAQPMALQALAPYLPEGAANVANYRLELDIQIEQRPDGLRLSIGSLTLHGDHAFTLSWKAEMPSPHIMQLRALGLLADDVQLVRASGAVKGLPEKMRYQLTLNSDQITRMQLEKWWPALSPMYAAHPRPWQHIKFGAWLSGDSSRLEIRDLKLLLDGELLQISGALGLAGNPRARLRIAARSLHADPWLPQPAAQTEAAGEGDKKETAEVKEPDLRFLSQWKVSAQIQVERLMLRGLELKNLGAALAGADGRFDLDPLHFELAGGRVNERASLFVNIYPVRWKESVKIMDVQVQPVLMALAGTDMLRGVLKLDTNLEGRGLLPETSMPSLAGRGNIQIRDGQIKGIDIPGTLRKLTTFGKDAGPKATDFSQLSGSFTVKKGIVNNNDLFMASPLFRLNGYGKIDLGRRHMNYHVKPKLVGSIVGQGDTEAVRKGLAIPLHITGPIDNPKIRPEVDPKSLINSVGALKKSLKAPKGKKIKEKLKKLLPKL